MIYPNFDKDKTNLKLKIDIHTTYPLKTPKISPKDLSIEPNPVQVTALLTAFPTIIIKNNNIKNKNSKPDIVDKIRLNIIFNNRL